MERQPGAQGNSQRATFSALFVPRNGHGQGLLGCQCVQQLLCYLLLAGSGLICRVAQLCFTIAYPVHCVCPAAAVQAPDEVSAALQSHLAQRKAAVEQKQDEAIPGLPPGVKARAECIGTA